MRLATLARVRRNLTVASDQNIEHLKGRTIKTIVASSGQKKKRCAKQKLGGSQRAVLAYGSGGRHLVRPLGR